MDTIGESTWTLPSELQIEDSKQPTVEQKISSNEEKSNSNIDNLDERDNQKKRRLDCSTQNDLLVLIFASMS